ncbi:MAG: MoaD/ThiS family protein [Candidatus Competibacteraceae bacterium]|nr:MoaD/ThiS family protein [Candidatus Competibacteraceae bacterium]
MKISILAFGKIAEIAGKSQWEEIPVQDTDSLRKKLENDFPALQNMSYRIAINKQIIHCNQPIQSSCEIALLPPFSGG